MLRQERRLLVLLKVAPPFLWLVTPRVVPVIHVSSVMLWTMM